MNLIAVLNDIDTEIQLLFVEQLNRLGHITASRCISVAENQRFESNANQRYM